MSNQSYVERQEDMDDNLFGSQFPFGTGNPAKPMLEHSDTNRILISDHQALCVTTVDLEINLLEMLNKRVKSESFTFFVNVLKANLYQVQKAQLTRDSMSREDYIRALQSKRERKGLFSFMSRKQPSSDAGEPSDDD
jgi:hypothetical protein